METILLEDGESKIGYDLFTWSDNRRAPSPNCLVGIYISEKVLSELSSLIWENSLEVFEEIPDYFFEFEVPFPSDKNAILHNPYVLNEYFEKSDLWADFIVAKLSVLQKWDFKNSIYHLLKFKEVIREGGALYFSFYAIDILRMSAQN